jgi:copper chaperone CopZ
MTTSRPLPESVLRTITLAVAGMTCGSCGRHVHQALAGLDGVRTAEVDRARAQAVVVYDPALVGPEDMSRALEDAGYTATVRSSEQPATGGL